MSLMMLFSAIFLSISFVVGFGIIILMRNFIVIINNEIENCSLAYKCIKWFKTGYIFKWLDDFIDFIVFD